MLKKKKNLQPSRPLDYGPERRRLDAEYAEKIGRMFTELISLDLDEGDAVSRFIERHFPERIDRDAVEMTNCVHAGALLADEIWQAFHSWEPVDRLSIAVNHLPSDRRIGPRRARIISLMHEFEFVHSADDEFWRGALGRSDPEFRRLTSEFMAAQRQRLRKEEKGVNIYNIAAALSLEVSAFDDERRKNETLMQARLRVSNNYRNAWNACVPIWRARNSRR